MTKLNLYYLLIGFFLAFNLLFGWRFATMTEEKAAAMSARNGGKPVDLKGMRTVGKVMLVMTPIIAAFLLWLRLGEMIA